MAASVFAGKSNIQETQVHESCGKTQSKEYSFLIGGQLG